MPRLARISQAAPPASPDSAQRPSDEVWVAVSLVLQQEEGPGTSRPDLGDEQSDGGPAAPPELLQDSYEVGHQRGTAKRGPFPMAPSRTRRAPFDATGSPVSRSL
ncbi:hypothetical protein [Dictyobacter formicarum]|uniref:hypothetical protein n=1 Tax=Dictyobacter formicarum TaxID=2778368 RepID=UPI001915AA5E|nr:hypothetical protein [Dictyobacter formicarum]